MFLWTGVSEQWIPLKFQEYGYRCPLEVYTKMVEFILPQEKDRYCSTFDNSILCG